MDKNEIVKYNSDLNKLTFRGFTACDMNILMALCSELQDQNIKEIVLSFNHIKKISGIKPKNEKEFLELLDHMSDNLLKVNSKIILRNKETDKIEKIIKFDLFPTWIIDPETQTITVAVNEKFSWLLNEFSYYTTFELLEFTSLSSKYSKTLYRLLKQWRTQGVYIFHDIADFREKMDIPKSFSNKIMIRDCIKRAVEEITALNKSFENFKFECIYDLHKRGKPLVGLKFSWKAEERKVTEIDDPFPPSKSKHYKKSKFTNIEQHNYDYKELEKKLLNTNNFSL